MMAVTNVQAQSAGMLCNISTEWMFTYRFRRAPSNLYANNTSGTVCQRRSLKACPLRPYVAPRNISALVIQSTDPFVDTQKRRTAGNRPM